MAKGGQSVKDPASPEMRAAWALFDAGDKVAARRAARALLAGNPSPDDRAQALELLRRCRTPLSVYAFALAAAAVFLFLVVLAALRY